MNWQTATTTDWKTLGWHPMMQIEGWSYLGTGLFFIVNALFIVLLVLLIALVIKKLK